MSSTQSHIQDQLQRKHEELQQLIVQQQEELRRVSEQLLMARYGLLPSIVNVAVPFSPISRAPNRSIQPQLNIQQHSANNPQLLHVEHTDVNQQNHCNINNEHIENSTLRSNSQHNDEMISYMQLGPMHTTNLEHQQHSNVHVQDISHPQHLRIEVADQHQQNQHFSTRVTNELEIMPYQMVEEQTQVLFTPQNNTNL